METLGLLAGIGHLPVDVAQSAKKLGYKVVAIAVVPETDPELPENVDVFYTINVGKVGKGQGGKDPPDTETEWCKECNHDRQGHERSII